MNYLFFIFLLIILPVSGAFSQSVTGITTERESNSPIPYSHIYNSQKQIGTVADENGKFELDISMLNKEVDSITISAIGYFSKTILTKEIVSNSTIELIPDDIQLEEIIVKSDAYKTTEIGNLKNPDYGGYSLSPGCEEACWIPNKKNYTGFIRSLSVYIKKEGMPNNPFRIHLYSRNEITSAPDKELLSKSIIAHGDLGNEWITINIDSLYVHIPKKGFFIGVEWIKSSINNVVIENWNGIEIKRYGQVVGMISEPFKKGDRTWFKGHMGKWEFYSTPSKIDGIKVANVGNLAVKAEIAYKKGVFDKEENTSIKYKEIKKKQFEKLSNFPEIDLKHYPNYSPKKLFESIYKAIEKDSIIYLFAHLCSYTKEAKNEVLEELTTRKENDSWITEEERKKALNDFDYCINNIEEAKLISVDIDKYKIVFPNKTRTFIEKKNNKWYLMPFFKVFRTI